MRLRKKIARNPVEGVAPLVSAEAIAMALESACARAMINAEEGTMRDTWSQRLELGVSVRPMPTVSRFFGIIIQMFWREHAPPHFHALYGEHEALIDIRTLEVIAGRLPKRALSLTIEWAIEHRHELLENWKRCQAKQQPNQISPLE